MPLDSNLIGLGVPAKVAEQIATFTTSAAPTLATANGLTATGSTISDALQLTSFSACMTTVASGTGVRLPDAPVGFPIFISNVGANALKVYPLNASSQITGIAPGGAGTAVTVTTSNLGIFFRVSATEYVQYA